MFYREKYSTFRVRFEKPIFLSRYKNVSILKKTAIIGEVIAPSTVQGKG
jgi:hypothetical protein